jgi:hypothetical protein
LNMLQIGSQIYIYITFFFHILMAKFGYWLDMKEKSLIIFLYFWLYTKN